VKYREEPSKKEGQDSALPPPESNSAAEGEKGRTAKGHPGDFGSPSFPVCPGLQGRPGLQRPEDFLGLRRIMGSKKEGSSLAVELGPLALKNPVLAASGTFGYGKSMPESFP